MATNDVFNADIMSSGFSAIVEPLPSAELTRNTHTTDTY